MFESRRNILLENVVREDLDVFLCIRTLASFFLIIIIIICKRYESCKFHATVNRTFTDMFMFMGTNLYDIVRVILIEIHITQVKRMIERRKKEDISFRYSC
jgi:hypothetical protein